MQSDAGLIVGVTATRSGLTVQQTEALILFLAGAPVIELHHGDCAGGDAQADEIARALGITRVAHPPDNDKLRAHRAAEAVLEPKPYKDRNKDIVAACHVLVALPATHTELLYGGTWSTVRHARSVGRTVVLILPNGTVRTEEPKRGRAGSKY